MNTTTPVARTASSDPFESSGPSGAMRHGDSESIRTHRQAETTAEWFFTTALGNEILASLTWRPFTDDIEASQVEPVAPVLYVAGHDLYRVTLAMPLRCPHRGEEGRLFLLVRGWRGGLPLCAMTGADEESRDDRQVEWAIIGRDPAKPRACHLSVLEDVKSLIERQSADDREWGKRWM